MPLSDPMTDTDFRYELFFHLTPDLMCIAGFDGYFKKINPAVAETLGYTMEELYARPINDFVHEEDKEITNKVRRELTRAKPLFNFENRYITKSGEIVWLSWTSWPVESEQLVFAIAKNVTYRKKLEAERNELLASLTKINKELKQINYTTSHDLRSPVNNLLSISNMIDVSRVGDQETIQLIEFLKLASQRLKQTLNTYVDKLSERESAHVNLEEVSLSETLGSVLQSIEGIARTSKVTVRIDFSAFDKIRFNKSWLESIFLNLITNSIKYARPDRPPVILITSEKIGNTGKLLVADNGLGFDMEKVKDRIFGLNQKFHDHADSKGIGLYLVFNHVTSLGGTINVDSRINEGTQFEIIFKEGSIVN